MASLYAAYATEDDARKKWCPLVRRAGGYGNTNADAGARLESTCIGSACMAWRRHHQTGIGPNGEKRDRDLDGRTRWVDVGYCGAFGHPDPATPQ